MKYTLLKRKRRKFLLDIGSKTADLRGDFVELGTWRGGSAKIVMDSLNRNSNGNFPDCWLFDSFTGMPEPTKHDRAMSGKHASEYRYGGMPDDDSETYRICCEYLERVKYPNEKIHIIKGMFEDTFPEYAGKIEKIKILHVDCDWYESTKYSLETFFDKVVTGGCIIFDDYGTWAGTKKAVDEFMVDNNLNISVLNKIDAAGYWFNK